MEVDGRVGERRGGEIYISKRISTLAGYTTIIMIIFHDLRVTVFVCSEGSALFHIIISMTITEVSKLTLVIHWPFL